MSQFTISRGKRFAGPVFALLPIFTVLLCAGFVCAQGKSGLQVGDTIEVEFMGGKHQGKITKFTGTGWPFVVIEYRGRSQERFFPDSRVRLIKSAGDADDAPMQSESREWEDSTGNFKIEGKLLSNKDGTVEIEKTDGRVIKLPLNKLSAKDQAYLKQQAAKSSSDNPFAGGEMKSAGGNSSSRNRSAPAGLRGVPAGTQAIEPAYSANEKILQARSWSYEPSPGPTPKPGSRIIPFTSSFTKHSFHNRVSGAHFGIGNKIFATTIGNPFESDSEIVVLDAEGGRAAPTKRIALKEAAMLDVSPDGSYAATRRNSRGSSKGAIDFWQVGGSLKHVAAWTTGGSRGGFSPSVGRFVGTTKLLTAGKRLVLWDIKTATAIYSAEMNSKVKPAFSPSGKEIAVGKGTMIHLVDIESGNSMGQFVPPPEASALAFSESGRFLAGFNTTSDSIWVWDLQANELAQELSGPQTATTLQWVGDKYLLINGNLIDVELRVPVWQYASSGGSVVSSQDGRYWFAGKSKLVPIILPHRNLDADTANFDPEALLVLKPGASVAFDFKLPFSPAEQKQIRDTFAGMLQKNQVTIDQSSTLRLVAKVTKQKQETMSLSSFGGFRGRGGAQNVTCTPHLGSLTLERDGAVLWDSKRRFGPSGIVSINKDETAQQAVNRISQPKVSFFTGATIPKFLATLPSGKPLGKSTISESGVN